MDYNDRMVDKLHDKWLDPPDDEESTNQQCCMCNNEAEYDVLGDLFCECCLHSEFRIRR